MKNWDANESIFAGMTTAQLTAALRSAQNAYISLLTGQKAVDVSYAQGDGSKHVRYSEANKSDLVALIAELKAQLGLTTRSRRPISFRF